MKKRSLVQFSVNHPKLVVAIAGVITLLFLTQFPKIQIDTNPKNMLPPTSDVRVWNDTVDQTFGLYEDTIVVGLVNESGVLNQKTLENIDAITQQIVRIKGVAAQDVKSLTTIDNVTAGAELISIRPLASPLPKSDVDIQNLRNALFDSSLFVGRVISRDEKATAIYVPLEKGANGKAVADDIRLILQSVQGNEEFYIAGDPVARDTFGAEMFKLMGIFAPIAGAIMMLVFFFMFRNIAMAMTMMAVAMISIIWTMGLIIGLGFPIHIMASMGPVFLMAIATDSVHIFNEFNFRYKETPDKRKAVLETMEAVGRPVRYTALATAVGFGVLLFMEIIPVKVFGGLVVFGTVALRLLSFSFIPAVLTFLKPEKLKATASGESMDNAAVRILGRLGSLGANHPLMIVTVCLGLLAIASVGLSRITVNNNMVGWFKPDSDIRTADRVLNERLGGTSLGHLIVSGPSPDFIKNPEALRFVEGLQRHLEQLSVVGKTLSVADYVKRINRVVHDDQHDFETIPDDAITVGQYLFLFGMSAKPADLNNVVDYPFQQANIWVQLKTWDAAAMEEVIEAAQTYRVNHELSVEIKPAGTAYFNLVWNQEVLWDMVKGFALALIAVFVILVVNFRSVKWAIIGYVPLLLTIVLIYGVIGFIGKDFDMPIAVLSCLSLGMAVDFSIHFIGRLRQRLGNMNGIQPSYYQLSAALIWTAMRTGRGIFRNAVLFAAAFSVMLFASLTPYITVGAFIVSMMLLSAALTVIVLPALIALMQKNLSYGVCVNAKTIEAHT
jgi:uncharacterized protein